MAPQHQASPEPVSPHVVDVLVMSATNVRPPLTPAGVVRSILVPSPSSPEKFEPQQNAAPVSVTPQTWEVDSAPPEERVTNVRPPATSVGRSRSIVVPSPTWP